MLEIVNAIIVDDEPAGRMILQTYLEKYITGVKVIGTAQNANEAYDLVMKVKPDLVFLDIEMPGQNGIAFLERFSPIPFEVIFTTAFEQYALKAFELAAVAYLLKPIHLDDLKKAIAKFHHNRSLEQHQRQIANFLEFWRKGYGRIAIHTTDAVEILEIKQIVRCQAESNYTQFFMADGKQWIASRTLREYEEKLIPSGFVRIHRSHLINLAFVKKYWKTRSHQIEMTDGATLSLSAGRKNEFLRRFSEEFDLDDL